MKVQAKVLVGCICFLLMIIGIQYLIFIDLQQEIAHLKMIGYNSAVMNMGEAYRLIKILASAVVICVLVVMIMIYCLIRQKKVKIENKQLKELSQRDDLTDLLNRRALRENVKNHIIKGDYSQEKIGVIMADIDCFKAYNDCYGHLEGDKIIQRVAQVLEESCKRKEDYVCRYGGEEFLIVLSCFELQDLEVIAKRVREALREAAMPHSCSKVSDYITLSMGIAMGNVACYQEFLELVRKADSVLYEVKETGRDNYKMAKD